MHTELIKIQYTGKKKLNAKYKLLINKRESTGLKYLNDSKTFIEYLNDMDDIYKNIEIHNAYLKRKY